LPKQNGNKVSGVVYPEDLMSLQVQLHRNRFAALMDEKERHIDP